jgi:putative hydrolase of the HAD superfamily
LRTKSGLDLIAFDGDDTLWHNERSYRDGRERFRRLLTKTGVDLTADEIEARVNGTELTNLAYYGYGVSSFTLSLIETAIDLTRGEISGADLRAVIELAKEMLTEEIELFPSAFETLTELGLSWPLMLITKGDLLHQTSKIDRSGLRERFRYIEVVSDKTRDVYSEILARHQVEPDRFLMIGNSLRSDILPVVEAGGWAVHIPAALSWSHEHADVPPRAEGRYFQAAALDQVPEIVAKLARRSPSRRSEPDAGRRPPAAGNRRS